MNKTVIALILFTGLTLTGCSKGTSHGHSAAVTTPQSEKAGPAPQQQPSKPARVPAHHATAPKLDELPPTLSPDLFTGNQRLAYQVAQRIPQTLAQLPCYCHCDMSIGHKSLHSCFVTEHGESCGICIGEALMAYQLAQQKLPIGEIRQRIIAAYGTASNQ